MLSRRGFLRSSVAAGALGTGALAAGSLSGCSSDDGRGDPDHVNLWGLWTSDLKSQVKIVDDFSKDHPDFTCTQSQVPTSSQGDASSVITAVRGGTAPDLWLLDRFTTPQYAAIGLLEPINDLIEEYEDQSVEEFSKQWIDFSMQEMSYDGKLYGLPFQTDSRVLLYNRGALEEAGIDYSALDSSNGPPTFDQVWDIHDQFTETDAKGNYTKVGFIPWDSQGGMYTWALGNGAGFYDERSCNVELASTEMLKTAEEYAGWVKDLNFPRVDAFKATYEPPSHAPGQTAFLTGHQAMAVDVPSTLVAAKNYVPDLDWAVTYIPVHKAGDPPFTWSGGHGLCTPKGSSHSKVMWELMKYYCGYPGQKISMTPMASVPTNQQDLEDPEGYDPDMQFFADSMAFSTCRAPLPVGNLIWDSLSSLEQSLQQGSATPQQAVDTAQQRVNPQMQQYCPFPLPEGFNQK